VMMSGQRKSSQVNMKVSTSRLHYRLPRFFPLSSV
jgi:hypothetical protein